MVAMAIMVYSFECRSITGWATPARPTCNCVSPSAATRRIVRRRSSKTRRVRAYRAFEFAVPSAPSRSGAAPVTLIARGATSAKTAADCRWCKLDRCRPPSNAEPAWISRGAARPLWIQIGQRDRLAACGPQPSLHGGRHLARLRAHHGDHRDLASGIPCRNRPDGSANEGSVWLNTGANAPLTKTALRARFARGELSRDIDEYALRERSLQIFDAPSHHYAARGHGRDHRPDRSELAASSTALARRRRVRHAAAYRHAAQQIVGMLASEGILTSAFGVDMARSRTALSLVLVYVINRQSFQLEHPISPIPAWELVMLSATLIAAAAVTAI